MLLATARGGLVAGQVLEEVSQASLQAALALANDAMLLSDGGRAHSVCARRLEVHHKAVNVSAGIQVRGSHHIQTVNNRHHQWRAFPEPFRGARRSIWTATCSGFSKSVWCARRPRVAVGDPQSCRYAYVSPIELLVLDRMRFRCHGKLANP